MELKRSFSWIRIVFGSERNMLKHTGELFRNLIPMELKIYFTAHPAVKFLKKYFAKPIVISK